MTDLIRSRLKFVAFVAAFVVGMLMSSSCPAEDWPTYLHDNARSGRSTEQLETPLRERWLFEAAHPPQPAWSPPIPGAVEGHVEANRVDFDRAFHVAVVDEHVYFGSSADDKLYCLDLATGSTQWTFFAGGPIRLAPTVADGRVYFGSDDGLVYCLRADTGRLLWKSRLGPSAKMHLGSGRMISRWPVRTGVLIAGSVAYAGAGIFPHEGVYLAAFDTKSGELLWINDSTGLDNGGRSRFSPQGYLLAGDDLLFVPTGRDLPAAFSQHTGDMRFHSKSSWRESGIVGGTYALLVDDQIITGANQNIAFDTDTGRLGFAWFPGRRMVVSGETSFMATDDAITAIDRAKYAEGSRTLRAMRGRHDGRSKTDPDYLWHVTRAELGFEKGKSPEQQDKTKIEMLTEQVAQYRAVLDEMEAEEAEYVRAFEQETTRWTVPWQGCDSLIATDTLLFAGGKDGVVAIESETGKVAWQAEVDGTALGLAAADGHLLVSTDRGDILCFGQERSVVNAPAVEPRPREHTAADDEVASGFAAIAESILRESGVHNGYCLVLDNETGRLALELAQQSDLKIVGIEPDAEKVASARRMLDRAGLYGVRVAVVEGSLETLPFSNFFANLVVSESYQTTGRLSGRPEEVGRVVRPLGGTVVLGSLEESFDPTAASPASPNALKEYLEAMKFSSQETDAIDIDSAEDRRNGGLWAKAVRGALPGAGAWNHQFGEPGNTATSNERRAKAPLGVLWYGEPGPTRMISRHFQGSPPLAFDGRLFVAAANVLLAYDAYNGVKLWEQAYEGRPRSHTRRLPGSLAASSDGLFLAVKNECLRFDPATGALLSTYKIQKRKGTSGYWSYLAAFDGLLIGSVSDGSWDREAKSLIAIDTRTGETRWEYQGQNIGHLAITAGEGRVYMVDGAMSDKDRERLLRQDRSAYATLAGTARDSAEAAVKAADLRTAIALDARTGKVMWSKPIDLTNCSGVHRSGGELAAMFKDGLLVFSGASGNGHYWQQFLDGEFKHRRILVLAADDGGEVWSRDADYRTRPIIVGNTVVADPWGYDLHTGEQRMRDHPVTGEPSAWQFIRSGHHCGFVSGCEHLLLFRSDSTAYYDLLRDVGAFHFSAQRSGCAINSIPANGLVHITEASAGCQCLYAVQCTVTLEPVSEDRDWGSFCTPGDTRPVKHLALNLGAPGDRRDGRGRLWLAHPRPKLGPKTAALGVELGIVTNPPSESSVYRRPANAEPNRTKDAPWIFDSGLAGLNRCVIPVIGPKGRPGNYTLRLYLATPDSNKPAGLPFHIRLQGQGRVSRACRIADGASVEEFNGLAILDDLEINLRVDSRMTTPPILNGIELIRTSDGL
jgi:outer membrane protein assembly factor BamB